MTLAKPKLDCRAEDLTGKKFNSLKVLAFSYRKPRDRGTGGASLYWLCKCSCGSEVIVQSGHLKSGNVKSCGVGPCSYQWTGCNLFCGAWLCKATKHSSSSLTSRDIIDKYKLQNGLCYLTGDKLIFPKTIKELKDSGCWNASIDRIDNNDRIYHRNNINLTTGTINLIRWDNTIDGFYSWCKDIYEYKVRHISDKPNNIIIHKFKSNYTGYKNISGKKWHVIQTNAKNRDIKFDLDIKDAWNLYMKQGGLCAISGRSIAFTSVLVGNGHSLTTASLDRIDSSKDYTIDNVQWVHKQVNKMRNQTTVEEFIQEISKVVKHRKLV